MKTYYMLTKPGIIFGNIVTTAAGFFLASKGGFDWLLFVYTLIGLGFVIASAGVFNNYIDRVMDAKMERTRSRPLVTGVVNATSALIFASALGLIGLGILAFFTNYLTVFVALFGFFVYLVLYAFWKYRSFYGTLVGSVAGAVPPVVGYCAASNQLDLAAFLLFAILVLWQMPHFFSIAIYRLEDYRAASIPVLPLEKGLYQTKVQMVYYIVVFTVVSALLTVAGYTGAVYLFVVAVLGSAWLALCLRGFKQVDEQRWARQMFGFSLVVIMGICLTMAIEPI